METTSSNGITFIPSSEVSKEAKDKLDKMMNLKIEAIKEILSKIESGHIKMPVSQ